MNIKLAVFDMAGTTVEDHDFVHQALIDALADENIPVLRDEVNEVMGYPKPIAIGRLLERRSAKTSAISEDLIFGIHDNFVARMVAFYSSDSRVKEKNGVTEAFLELKRRGIMIGIDTGFSRRIADTIFNRLGWDESLFDYSVTSDEVSRGRPFPDMIFKLMEMADIRQPEHVAKIGDTVSDLLQGQAAGCRYVIGVTSGAFKRDELKNEYHTHLIADIREVLTIL